MNRASQVFEIDETESDSPVIEKVWTSLSAPDSAFLSVAESRWQIVVTDTGARSSVVLQAPNDAATVTPIPMNAQFLGIVLRLGTHMPGIALADHLGGALLLPDAGGRAFWLGGRRWEIPTVDNADVFVDHLIRNELLVQDRFVADALRDDHDEPSLRTLQRRVRRATGLTQMDIRQIARAQEAVQALGAGVPPAAAAAALGYADQSHLTRSLRRFIGQTPGEVLHTGMHWSPSSPVRSRMPAAVEVSFSFNTPAEARP